MPYRRRVDTLRILISGHNVLAGSSKLSDIVNELNRIKGSGRLPSRNWLLAVLHTTRALDTTLSEIVLAKGWRARSPALGAYLTTLQSNAILSQAERIHYRRSVVDRRNMYMHQANAMPSRVDADSILAEMHSCVFVVLGRL